MFALSIVEFAVIVAAWTPALLWSLWSLGIVDALVLKPLAHWSLDWFETGCELVRDREPGRLPLRCHVAYWLIHRECIVAHLDPLDQPA